MDSPNSALVRSHLPVQRREDEFQEGIEREKADAANGCAWYVTDFWTVKDSGAQ